jgi:hypothetical protein
MKTEWTELCEQHPNISFNDYPQNRDKDKYLFAVEAYNIKPENYDIDICKQYRGIITWSSKFYNICKSNGIKVYKINGFPRPDDFYNITHNINFECREGVCLICRVRSSQTEGDISGERIVCFNSINTVSKTCYGKTPYCRQHYGGVIGNTEIETIPSSKAKLEKLNTFRFNICFENCYHELWSWDYITEKIFDCFKAKCVPIYYGAFNIEQIIPEEFFIDYRKYNYGELNTLLADFPKQRFIDMTERAYEWNEKCRWGNMDDLRAFLKELK